MSIVTIILVFTISWWLVFFMLLPVGVVAQHEDKEGVTMGTTPSAPVKPRLLKKALWATLIAGAITAGFYWLEGSGLITFRDAAQLQ